MKTLILLLATASIAAHAQTTYTSLYNQAGSAPVSCCVDTNDAVTLMSIAGNGTTITGFTPLGFVKLNAGNIYSGFTNVVLTNSGTGFSYASLQITHAQTACTVSNYVPADAIVIPASAGGSVQIILETSPDLVNWTAASPGTYGANTGTNRFFRVRAAVQ